MIESSKELGPWRERVALVAHGEMQGSTILPRTQPVLVDVIFYMPRPASLPKKVTAMVKRPDVDKIGRAILDALTDVCFEDDSQVVDLLLHKRYVNESHPEPGAEIQVVGLEN